MQKKSKLFLSFALAAILVIGPMAFSVGASEDNGGMGNMMNGNGMSNMMEAMNSPEGQEMMNSCSKFMSSYDDSDDSKSE